MAGNSGDVFIVNRHGLRFCFRVGEDGNKIERTILNDGGSELDGNLSIWKPATLEFLEAIKPDNPAFSNWIDKKLPILFELK